MNLERDFAKLTQQLKDNKEVIVEISSVGTQEEAFSLGLINKALGYIQQTQAEGTVQFIISELLLNTEQALIKRELSKEKNVATTDQPLLSNLRQYNHRYTTDWRESQTEENPNIKVGLKLSEEQFQITVSGEGVLDELELKYIQAGFDLGKNARHFQDVSDMAQKTAQGDGHGLALCILTLKQGNFDVTNLSFEQIDQEIIFTLKIPVNHVGPKKLESIDERLVREINTLPVFPELIVQIQQLCQSDNSDLKQVANAIQKDPAIASQIIKLANSGGFSGGQVASVLDAVKVVGLNNISDLLLNVGSMNILGKKYHISNEHIEHPVRVGFFSKSLAIMHDKTKVAEKAYVAGLLHDIGKVVLMASFKSKRDFEAIAQKRDRRNQIQLEEMTIGVSHAIVGALLAHKWKFPEILKTAIEFHHTPYNSPKDQKDIIFIVYLANCMANYLENDIHYYSIEPDVLAYFNMTTEESFQLTATAMENDYQNQK